MSHCRKGFTLVELMITVAILSILSVVAVAAYKGYQEQVLEKEATAGMFSIANDAQRLIQDWGLASLGGGITEECYAPNPSSTAPNMAVEWDSGNDNKWTQSGISLSGSQHWRYQLCFYVDTNHNENYFVSATLIKERNTQRVAVLYSGLDKPQFLDSATAPADCTTCSSWQAQITPSSD